jgi:nitrile hydratase
MSAPNRVAHATASMEQRVDAIQAALDERGLKASEAVAELGHLAQDVWTPKNGARVVAKAWTDPEFRTRLLANGRAASRSSASRCRSTTGISSCWRTRRRSRT